MAKFQIFLGLIIVALLVATVYFFVLPSIPKGSFFPFYEAITNPQSYLAISSNRVLQGEPISVAVGVFGTGDPFTTGLSPSYYYVGYLLDGHFIDFERTNAREYAWSGEKCMGWTGDECIYKFNYSLSTFPAFFRLIKGVYSYTINSAALPVGNHTLAVAYAPVHPGSDYRNEADLFQAGASCDAHLTGGSYGVDRCAVFGWSKGYSLQSSYVCSGSGSLAYCPTPYQIGSIECRSSCCQPSWCGGGWCSSTAPAECYSGSSGRIETCNCSNGRRGLPGGWSESVIFSKTREQAQAEIGWVTLASVDFEVVQEVSCGAGFEHPAGDVSQCVAIAGYCGVDADCAGSVIDNGRILGHCIGNECVSETVCDSGFDLANGACVGQSVIPPVIPPIIPPVIPPIVSPIVPPISQQPPSNILIWLIVFGVIGFLIFIAWWSRD